MKPQLLKGSLWISGARVTANFLNFVGMLVLARILVPEDFGLVALGTAILVIVTAVTDIPVAEALVQHREPTRDHFHAAWTLGLLRAVLVALVCVVIAHPLARFYDDPRLANVVLALGVYAFLAGLNNPRAIMLTKELIFWQQFMLQVAQKLVGLIVTVTLAIHYQSYWALIIGTVAGQFANTLISYSVLPFRPRVRLKHSRELLSFSIWLTLSKIINTINWNVDQLLIGTFAGKTELGHYAIGNNLASLPTREVSEPLITTLFPAFSRMNDQPERLSAAYQSAQSFLVAIVWPIGIGMALIADPLVRLTMGEKWLPIVVLVQILAPVFAFQAIGNVAQPLAMATGRTASVFRRDLKIFLFRVPIILLGMYYGGFMGVVWARSFTGTVGTIFNLNVVRDITGLSLVDQMRPNTRTLLGSVSMVAAVWLLNASWTTRSDWTGLLTHLLASMAVGFLAYAATVWISWRVMGSPTGPETELIKIAGMLRKVARPAT